MSPILSVEEFDQLRTTVQRQWELSPLDQVLARRADLRERLGTLESYAHRSQPQARELEEVLAESGFLDEMITERQLVERAGKIAEIRRAAADPANREGPAGGSQPGAPALISDRRSDARETPEQIIARSGDPWRGEAGRLGHPDVTGAGMISRAHSAIEAMEGQLTRNGSEKLAELLSVRLSTTGIYEQRTAEDIRRSAEFIVAMSNPWYTSAVRHILLDPMAFRGGTGYLRWNDREREAFTDVEVCRAAFAESSVATGSVLLPLELDPTIILTNAGAANPFRRLARNVMTSSNTWNGVTSAGVTAQWLAEGTAAADATPSVAALVITPYKQAAWLYGSLEITQDTNIGAQVPRLVADARDRLEATAFAVGSGSGQPYGVVTRGTSDATVGSLTAAMVYALHQALAPRFRLAEGATPSWLANVAIIDALRQIPKFTGAVQSLVDDGQADNIPEVLSVDINESSAMDNTQATGKKTLLFGDFSQYLVVDRLPGTEVIYEPLVKSGSPLTPTGQVGWFAYCRVGGDVTTGTAFQFHTN